MNRLILNILKPVLRIKFIKSVVLKFFYFHQNFKTFLLRNISKALPHLILLIAPKSLIKNQENNILMPTKKGFWETLIDGAKSEIYNKKSDSEKLIRVNKLWSEKDGYKWIKYDQKNNQIEKIVDKRKNIYFLIDQYLNENKNIKTICEIGTGDGRYLNFLADKFSGIKTFIGVDLNAKMMEENNNKYKKNKKLIFLHGKVNQKYDRVKEISSNSILFVSFRTLTWFTQLELEELFSFIANKKEFLSLAFFEQNEICSEKETKSKVRTGILFNSHNYKILLKKCGLMIVKEHIKMHNNLIKDHEISIIANNKKFNK